MSVSSLELRFREIAQIQSVWKNKKITFEQEGDVEEADEFFVNVEEVETMYITVKNREIMASVDNFLSHFEVIGSLHIELEFGEKVTLKGPRNVKKLHLLDISEPTELCRTSRFPPHLEHTDELQFVNVISDYYIQLDKYYMQKFSNLKSFHVMMKCSTGQFMRLRERFLRQIMCDSVKFHGTLSSYFSICKINYNLYIY